MHPWTLASHQFVVMYNFPSPRPLCTGSSCSYREPDLRSESKTAGRVGCHRERPLYPAASCGSASISSGRPALGCGRLWTSADGRNRLSKRGTIGVGWGGGPLKCGSQR